MTREDRESVLIASSPSAHCACEVDWADLPVIDISKAKTPEGRKELASAVRDAMRIHGFMFIVNHGLTEAEVSASDWLGRTAYMHVDSIESRTSA